jgi:hypothetical protein
MDLDEIRHAGSKSYFTDKGVYQNPYPFASNEFNAFENGWTQSLKRDEAKLINMRSAPADPEILRKFNKAQIQAELYRSRKG